MPTSPARIKCQWRFECKYTVCRILNRLSIYTAVLDDSVVSLTTTGRSMATKQQNLCLSSMRAFLRACFSVSSSRMYLSLTSCMALSNWGCISPRPWEGGGGKERGAHKRKKYCISIKTWLLHYWAECRRKWLTFFATELITIIMRATISIIKLLNAVINAIFIEVSGLISSDLK